MPLRRLVPWLPLVLACLTGCGPGGVTDLLPGSYLDDVLLEGRYTMRFTETPVRVVIDTDAPPADYQPEYRAFVVDALAQWDSAAGTSLDLELVGTYPDITVRWVSEIPNQDTTPTGVTTISYADSCFYAPIVELALYAGGERVPDPEVHATTIHELGHAIGLAGHSADPHDVMYESNTATTLTAADRATVQDLYRRPARYPECSTTGARRYPPGNARLIMMPSSTRFSWSR